MKTSILTMFVKFPRLGYAKTRLTHPDHSPQPLTPEQALAVYQSFLNDLIPRFRAQNDFDFQILLGGASPAQQEVFRQQFGLSPNQVTPMPTDAHDLGEMMERCFDMQAQRGYQKIVLVGSDVPQLTVERIQQALDALGVVQMVIGPDNGGGMYLVGYTKPLGVMRDGIPWSQGKDRKIILERCHAASISTHLLPEEIDVDTTEDLKAWQASSALSQAEQLVCPHTSETIQSILSSQV